MTEDDELRAGFGAAVSGAGSPQAAADRLCHACVELLDVDGASIALTLNGQNRGTFGASSPFSRHLDELQFTLGEGPCLDAAGSNAPVLVADLHDTDRRWPAFTSAVVQAGVGAVFALPVRLSAQPVGALDLFTSRRGALDGHALAGGLLAAELAALPLLDVLAAHAGWEAAGQPEDGWDRLASLQRVEVYQAVGMLMGAFDVDQTEALVRLRARAFARGVTASKLAGQIVDRQVPLDRSDWLDLEQSGPSR